MRTTVHRPLAAAVLAIGLGTTGCSSDDVTDTVPLDDTAADSVVEDDVAVDGLVGLEVTAVGNVSDVVSGEAMRLDRDGLGAPGDPGGVGGPFDYEYDYDFYDREDLIKYDEGFEDDDAVEDGVLVVDGTGLATFDVADAVRVSGTIRQFDQDSIESLYGVDLEDDVFDGYENQLVIVADSIRPADAPGAAEQGSQGGSTPRPTT